MQSDDLGLVARLRCGVQENEPYSTLARWNIGAADDLMTAAADAIAAKDAAIERLVAEARQAALGEDVANALLQRSRDHVDRLKEALKPFADAAESIDDTVPDRAEMWEAPAAMETTAGDFRRARQALKDAP